MTLRQISVVEESWRIDGAFASPLPLSAVSIGSE
jgi:hypothetical protein